MSEPILLTSTEQFSQWVDDQRVKHGMSRRKLLKLAGLSHATMTKVSWNGDMRMSTVAHIAHVFGYKIALIRDTERDEAYAMAQKSPALSGEAHDTVEGVGD
jgi:hypothetical protein